MHYDKYIFFYFNSLPMQVVGGTYIAFCLLFIYLVMETYDEERSALLGVFLIFACANSFFILVSFVYWFTGGDGMMVMQGILTTIANNFVVSIVGITTIFAAFSAGIANISIYAMCITYGVPFRLTITNARNAFDLLIEIVAVGFAVIFPLLYAFGGLNENFEFGILIFPLALSLVIGILYIISFLRFRRMVKLMTVESRGRFKWLKILAKTFALLIFIASILWAFLIRENPTTNPLGDDFLVYATIICLVYIAIPSLLLFGKIISRVLGDHDDLFTTSIGEKSYLAVLRYSKDEWVCLPCKITDTDAETNGEKGTIVYEHGKMAVLSIKAMDNITTRKRVKYHFTREPNTV